MRCNKPKDTFIQKTYYVAKIFPSSGVDISIASVEYMRKKYFFFFMYTSFFWVKIQINKYGPLAPPPPPKIEIAKL